MQTRTHRSVIIQRKDAPATTPDRVRATRVATMDHRDEEIELAMLFYRHEERLRDLAAIDGWMRGRERP